MLKTPALAILFLAMAVSFGCTKNNAVMPCDPEFGAEFFTAGTLVALAKGKEEIAKARATVSSLDRKFGNHPRCALPKSMSVDLGGGREASASKEMGVIDIRANITIFNRELDKRSADLEGRK